MKKILIVGSSAKEYALANKLKSYDCEITVAPGNERIKDIAACVDIRENNIKELLEYALENGTDLTIASSSKAIANDIVSLFQANNQLIFAPELNSAAEILNLAACKKFLYKLRIPTPRFGIFEKPSMAFDYLKTAQMPQVIRAEGADAVVCTTFSSAKTFVEDLFNRGEEKVILQDYVFGHDFTLYIITDGYHVLPITTVANYKFSQDGEGGLLTSGTGAFTPDYKVSKELQDTILKHTAVNIIDYLEKRGTPYMGIIGIDCVLKDDGKCSVLELKPFFSDHDAQAVLNLVDENLLTLFEACSIGSFADDFRTIKINDLSSVSCVISSRLENKIIEGLDEVESDIAFFPVKKNNYLEYETVKGRNLVLTKTAKTLSRAVKQLYDDVEHIKFEGKKYRTDICRQVDNF